MVNWYAVAEDDRWTVFDAGTLGYWPQLDAHTVYVGHGEPWSDGVRSAVERVRAVGPT
jgi:hypothetical protein